MIDVTESDAQLQPSAKTMLELYLKISPLIGKIVRADALDEHGSEIVASISGTLESVKLEEDSDFYADGGIAVWVAIAGDGEAVCVALTDRFYRLDGLDWTVVNEPNADQEEDDDY